MKLSKPKYKVFDYRIVKKFAYLPVRLDSNVIIWFQHYYSIQVFADANPEACFEGYSTQKRFTFDKKYGSVHYYKNDWTDMYLYETLEEIKLPPLTTLIPESIQLNHGNINSRNL